ncbi:MAG: hypothetical protein UY07_C0009G0006 [Parcubacteria group bacterium GW2011_GWA1_47_8]|nr:MAG: hypothetical protein UY07_C0009G0006 [Parcubacteria group bacterium GW2011_GWA1_47_8]KKW07919.1 MAG: hypothetical protein UY42_C0003G0011 [Parcubacteria group bacterium GW2011_GWA2_49_16]
MRFADISRLLKNIGGKSSMTRGILWDLSSSQRPRQNSMPKLPAITPKKLLKMLAKAGFEIDHTTGGHYISEPIHYLAVPCQKTIIFERKTRRRACHNELWQERDEVLQPKIRVFGQGEDSGWVLIPSKRQCTRDSPFSPKRCP